MSKPSVIPNGLGSTINVLGDVLASYEFTRHTTAVQERSGEWKLFKAVLELALHDLALPHYGMHTWACYRCEAQDFFMGETLETYVEPLGINASAAREALVVKVTPHVRGKGWHK